MRLLMMIRYPICNGFEEIGPAVENPGHQDIPSVFATLPKLLERSGTAARYYYRFIYCLVTVMIRMNPFRCQEES